MTPNVLRNLTNLSRYDVIDVIVIDSYHPTGKFHEVCQDLILLDHNAMMKYEPVCEKTNSFRHKPGCTVTEES